MSPGNPEDRRAAASLVAQIAGMLFTTALAIIAAQAGFITFVLDKRAAGRLFWILLLLGLGAAIASMVLGGCGLSELSRRGYSGDWPVRTRGGAFNWQAGLVLLAVIFSTLSLLDTRPKESELDVLKKQVMQIEKDLNSLKTK